MEKQLIKEHELEKDLIGLILQNPDVLADIMAIVQLGDITHAKNRAIYKAAIELYSQNEAVDIISIKNLSDVDGAYLSYLLDTLPGNPLTVAKQVKKNADNRWAASYVKSQLGRIPLPQLADALTNYATGQDIEDSSRHPDIKTVIERFKTIQKQNEEQGSLGIPTGFNFLEEKMIQYVAGMLWIIGGFTSVGKTYLMVEMISRLLQAGGSRILIISTEMSEEQIVARLLANLTGFNANVILSGRLHESKKPELEKATKWLQGRNLTIYDTIFSINEINARIKKAARKGGVAVVFIDYLQNCTVPGTKDIYTEMSRLIKSLQQQAKLSKTTIVALSQISNSAAKEENILEFKGAGEIAATADLALKLNRYKNDERHMLVTIGKGRHWQKGCQVLRFTNNWTRLEEIDHIDNR